MRQDRQHPTVEALQAALDGWLVEYNSDRPHQSCCGRPPSERFALADRSLQVVDPSVEEVRPRGKVGPRRWG